MTTKTLVTLSYDLVSQAVEDIWTGELETDQAVLLSVYYDDEEEELNYFFTNDSDPSEGTIILLNSLTSNELNIQLELLNEQASLDNIDEDVLSEVLECITTIIQNENSDVLSDGYLLRNPADKNRGTQHLLKGFLVRIPVYLVSIAIDDFKSGLLDINKTISLMVTPYILDKKLERINLHLTSEKCGFGANELELMNTDENQDFKELMLLLKGYSESGNYTKEKLGLLTEDLYSILNKVESEVISDGRLKRGFSA